MGSIWGNQLKLSISVESHGKGSAVSMAFLPGLPLTGVYRNEMARRAPGNNPLQQAGEKKTGQ
jgi:chorismate synthase